MNKFIEKMMKEVENNDLRHYKTTMKELSEFPFWFDWDDGWTDAPVTVFSNGSVDDHQGHTIAPPVKDIEDFLKDTYQYFLSEKELKEES
jgi:hypothetical protein